MKILVTGTAGFIGFHLTKRLLSEGHQVFGLDNLNSYYDVTLKQSRLNELPQDKLNFKKLELADKSNLEKYYAEVNPDYVVHLAAQAGVRYSLSNPQTYIDSNITGFLNILEIARNNSPKHLIYASSSSVYGINRKLPFSVKDNVDHPKSLYATSKKSNELMAHTYSELFNIPTTGLRFFTVYGPWGRPDMALFLFTKSIIEGEAINVFNSGNMKRDFTYIDDIVEGIVRLIPKPPTNMENWSAESPCPSFSSCPYQVFNIGNNNPVVLNDFISILEDCIGKKAKKNFLPMQPGDVLETYADIDDLNRFIGFKPNTSIEEGILNFVNWYKDYFNIKI